MLNPNCAHAWMVRGYISFYQVRPGPAVDAFERAMRLSPLDPLGYLFTAGLGFAHLAGGRYEEAVQWVDRSLRELPRYGASIRIKVVLCVRLGRMEEARYWLGRMVELQPGMTIAWFKEYAAAMRFPPEFFALYVEALREAGLPEG
jgi:adenylate cyclase